MDTEIRLSPRPLPRAFFEDDTVSVARALIGKYLVNISPSGVTSGIITETEAYTGLNDPASHSYKKNSKRVSVQYRESGLAYIFMIYGMYFCFNVTTSKLGSPEVVLIRALKPVSGIDLMKARRKTELITRLTDGPGKLTQAMGINMSHYGTDLTNSDLFIAFPEKPAVYNIKATRRINIDYAGHARDFPYRFVITD